MTPATAAGGDVPSGAPWRSNPFGQEVVLMMSLRIPRWRLTPWLLTTGLVLAVGCQDERQPLAVNAPPAALTVGLDVSSLTAPSGSRIAVALRVQDSLAEPLQGLQAYLHFDPARLTYVGQSTRDAGMVLVNAQQAGRGELRLIAVDAAGLQARVATLIFQVGGADYTAGLRLQFEGAASLHGEYLAAKPRALSLAADLPVDAAARYTAADWMARLAPREYAAWQDHAQLTPGQYAANLKYGDATLDGNLNVLDVVYIANVSVGVTSLIDNSNRDAVIAGNVRPINGGTGGSPRPGVEPGTGTPDGVINVLDVVAIANESVGNLVSVVGDVIPG